MIIGLARDFATAFRRWIRVAGPGAAGIVGVVCVAAFWWDKI